MMKRKVSRLLMAFGLLSSPCLVLAHDMSTEGSAVVAGFSHAFFGWDHLLSLLAVGLLAARQSTQIRWHIPLTFLLMLMLGVFAAIDGIQLPLVEEIIVGSLMVLGAMLLSSGTQSIPFIIIPVGLFALFHGYAHGAGMLQTSSATLNLLGFLLAATLFQGIGFALGAIWRSKQKELRILTWIERPSMKLES